MRRACRTVVASLCVACGQVPELEPGDSAGSSASTSGSSSGDDSGGSSATSGTRPDDLPTDGSSSGSTGGAPVCPEDPNETGAPVDVTIRNATADPIVLNGGACDPHFSVIDLNAGTGVEAWPSPCSPGRCPDLSPPDDACEPCDCFPQQLVLAPGGTLATGWDGHIHTVVTMPQACVDPCPDGYPRTCDLATRAPAGDYELVAPAMTTVTCQGNCECEPNADGWCKPGGEPWSGAALSASVTITYGEASAVEIVFE